MADRPRSRRHSKNTFTTRSGKTIKINRSLSERIKANRDARLRRSANRLADLPKGRVKRLLYRLEPRRLAAYWFSRDGLIMALKLIGAGIAIMFVLSVGLFAYFRKDLPQLNNIQGGSLAGSISYYDRTGNTLLWQDYSAVKRIPVNGNQISPMMKDATVAIEDKNYFHEGAFSISGILRASIHDFFNGNSGLQGGSTITQQVVKLNENWTNNHTVVRKIKEIILAVDLGREYSKDDILTGYLNVAPYGGVEYGIETAARDYFGVDANQLTLAQASMLAAIPQSPAVYSPYSSPQYNPSATANYFDPSALINRQHYILDQMVKQHYITQTDADNAKKVDILSQVHPLLQKYSGIKAPYFVLSAKQELENKYGAATVNRGGWKVITTLDLNMQNKAEQIVASNLPSVKRLTGGAADEEATVAENVPTGQIVALVGGVDFNNPDHGQDNYASGILIPPGSSFKPYDYSTLINNNNNVGAGSVLYDSQSPLPGYPCTDKNHPKTDPNANCLWDYDFLYPGPEPLRYALGGSRNVPAVKAMLEAVPNDNSPGKIDSVNKVIATATAMIDNPYKQAQYSYNCYADTALTKTTQCYGASAIGDGAFLYLDDHVNGLATLGRLGVAIPRTYILKISDAEGKVVDQWTQPKGVQALKPDAAYIVDNMASDPNASYLPGSCSATNCSPLSSYGYKFQRDNGWSFAVKTGTTNNGFDGLMTSWSSQYAVVSWVGNHSRNVNLSAYSGAAMETLTEPMTRGMMEALHAGLKPVNWVQPSDIKTLPAYVLHNHIHYGDIEPSPANDLFPSWYLPSGKASATTSQTVDKISNKLATDCTPPAAKQTQSGGNDNAFSVDIFFPPGGNASNAVTTSTDDVHSCSDPSLPTPSVTVDNNNGNAITPDGNGTYNCNSSCQLVVALDLSGIPQSTGGSSPYPRFPVTVNLLNGSQVLTSQQINSPSSTTLTFSYSPTAGASPVQLSVQLSDNALYQSNSNTVQVAASNQGNGNGNGH